MKRRFGKGIRKLNERLNYTQKANRELKRSCRWQSSKPRVRLCKMLGVIEMKMRQKKRDSYAICDIEIKGVGYEN